MLLQGLLGQLQAWKDRIRRVTYADDVRLIPGKDGEFVVRVEWKTKDGEVQNFDRAFTRREVFGGSYTEGPRGWRVQKKTCDYARSVMREALSSRGV
jgi:hypothetical protein